LSSPSSLGSNEPDKDGFAVIEFRLNRFGVVAGGEFCGKRPMVIGIYPGSGKDERERYREPKELRENH